MTINEQVVERIISLIENGVLKKGERIPSLRSLSGQLNVSVNTVREAYWKLENRMYIEAVPQSGYYVRRPPPSEKSVRSMSPAELDPREVTICTVYSALKKAEDAGKLVQLGVAVLDRSYWPEGTMTRFHQKAMRQHPEEVFDYMISPGYLPLR
jgi:DNA-binding transcriptional MocR family regulator